MVQTTGFNPTAPAIGGVAGYDPYDLLEGGKKSIKFVQKDANGFDQHAPVGTSFTGLMNGDLIATQVTNFESKLPEFYPDGRPKMQVAIPLATDLRDPADPGDDGSRMLYVKNQMMSAFQAAARPFAPRRVGIGTRITVTLVEYKNTGKGNPQKIYRVDIGPEFVDYVPAEQRVVDQAVFGSQPAQVGAFVQAAQQQGFLPQAQMQAPQAPAPQQQYVQPAQPAFPGQVVPQAQPVQQAPVYPTGAEVAQAVAPQAPQAPAQPQQSAAAAALQALMPQAPVAPAAPAPAGIDAEELAAINTIVNGSGVDVQQATAALAQQLGKDPAWQQAAQAAYLQQAQG